MRQLVDRIQRNLRIAGQAWESDYTRSEGIVLFHPRAPWYAENAPEMLRLLSDTRTELQEGLGIAADGDLTCVVAEPDWVEEALGVSGLALGDVIVVACRPRCLSEFAGTAAHELAHVLSRTVGPPESPFKSEGFACYAAEVIDADTRPFGLPLHYHLVWMLSVGLRPTLHELWARRDYTCELYDLGWSFATYFIETYGLARYYAFYRSTEKALEARVEECFGVGSSKLQRVWYDLATACTPVGGLAISRMRRYTGLTCSRAAWLNSR